MRLLQLTIKNFRVIRSAHLELPDQVIGIIGRNGAGKSSIVEAIAWALYGNVAARSAKDEIRATFAGASDDVSVDLEFEIHGEQYQVIRKLVGRTERPEVMLYRGGASESVGSTETQKQIARLLGLEWKGFLTSFLARQQELNALSDLAAGKRREHLAGMLGIDRLDKVIQLIKGDTRANAELATVLAKQLDEREHVVGRIGELTGQLDQLRKRQVEAFGARETAEQELAKIRQLFEATQSAKDACSRVESERNVEQERLSGLAEQLKRVEDELSQMLLAEDRVLRLQPLVADHQRIKAEYEREHQAAQAVNLYREIETQKNNATAELSLTEQAVEAARVELKKLKDQHSSIPDSLESTVAQLQIDLEKAREQYSALRSEREVAARDLDRLIVQQQDINNLGPDAVCDRCHRPFGEDLVEIRNHLDLELKKAQGHLEDQKVKVDQIKSDGERLKREFEQKQSELSILKDLNGRIATASSDLKRHELQADKNRQTLKQLVERLRTLTRPDSDPEKLQQLKQQLEQIETNRRELDRLSGQVGRKPQLLEQKESARKSKAESLAKIESLNQQLAEIGFDPERFAIQSEQLKAATRDLETRNRLAVETSKELEIIENELKLREEQLASFGQLEADLEKSRSAHFYGEKLGGLFGEFRKYLIASIRPRLAEFSTGLFSEMTADRYGLVELDEEYNLRIMDNAVMYGIERFSGGEKDLANLCLRLAISMALTESANLDRSFVILDEVFGSQDDDRRELIFKGLANLKQRFPQIFLITHISELKNRVETLIEIDPTSNGWSEVKLNGKLVS